jgi:hypothetical protein
MGAVYTSIPDELGFLRKIPITGTWAMLVGNPYAPRGQKLPDFCKDIGLRQMDVIYIFNEQMASEKLRQIYFHLSQTRIRRRVDVDDLDFKDLEITERGFARAIREVYDDSPFPELNQNIYDANVAVGETVRFWDIELTFMTEEKIKYYLSENAIFPITVEGSLIQEVPVLQNDIKELLGAMELDGLSRNEALNEATKMLSSCQIEGVKVKDLAQQIKIPNYYYRVNDEVYNAFN